MADLWWHIILLLGERLQSLTRLLTFLLGFYMSRTVASWSDTVRKIPTMEPSLLIFAGLVSHDNSKFSLPVSKEGKKSCIDFSGAVLEAKKTIARYGILAWVLCFNTISLSFNRKFKTVEQLKKKGLLKEREESGLKVWILNIDLSITNFFRHSSRPNLPREWSPSLGRFLSTGLSPSS